MIDVWENEGMEGENIIKWLNMRKGVWRTGMSIRVWVMINTILLIFVIHNLQRLLGRRTDG